MSKWRGEGVQGGRGEGCADPLPMFRPDLPKGLMGGPYGGYLITPGREVTCPWDLGHGKHQPCKNERKKCAQLKVGDKLMSEAKIRAPKNHCNSPPPKK